MTVAKRLHRHSRATGRPQTVLTIVGDDHNVHCLTEPQLDAWWASLKPHEKADLYERDLEAADLDGDDLVGNAYVHLKDAETVLTEARRVIAAFEALNTVKLDARGRPALEN